MLVIGICDDVQEARFALRCTLERVLERQREEAVFYEFSGGEGLLRWAQSHAGELDLVFLDLEMGELSGMETARRLRAADAGVQLVFMTGHADGVFEGYSVGALGYLLKPPREEQLEPVLTRARAALCRALERAYVCRSGDVRYRIPLEEILYFASDRLDEVAAELGSEFVRVHQRYLVRAAAVERIEGAQVMVGGQPLPVSRSCREQALLALTRAALEE